MTVAWFAAAAPTGSAASPGYVPGVCNIGSAEVQRPRRVGHVGLAVTLIALVALVAASAPPVVRLVLVLPAAIAASGYLQAWLRFCAGFGARGVFNFGAVGRLDDVDDPDSRSRDRRRAHQIGLASLAIGVLVAIAAALIPM